VAAEVTLLDAARRGDAAAFEQPVAPHRAELHAHCYRMLASVQDAEDALQEALLGAWRGLPRFEGRSSLRSWLYKVATNACLKLVVRRPRLVLPIDYAPAADPHGEPLWVEPYPDAGLAYEQRESVELAFIAREGWPFAAIGTPRQRVPSAHGVNVLTLRGKKIADSVTFLDASLFARFGLPDHVD
jgi:RNA polymerase sigma-70 factor (ECF subfamily)